MPGSFWAHIASKRAPNIAGNLVGDFAADVAREGAWKFGSQKARQGAWKFGSKVAREPGRFGAQIASKRAPNIACNLSGIVAGVVAFSLAAQVGREIAGNIGYIAGNLLAILAAFWPHSEHSLLATIATCVIPRHGHPATGPRVSWNLWL